MPKAESSLINKDILSLDKQLQHSQEDSLLAAQNSLVCYYEACALKDKGDTVIESDIDSFLQSSYASARLHCGNATRCRDSRLKLLSTMAIKNKELKSVVSCI